MKRDKALQKISARDIYQNDPFYSESSHWDNDDIEKSQPKKLHQPLNKPYYYLRNNDIEFTAPKIHKFKTNRSPSNPLDPKYKLASFEPLEPIYPKFIRDTINVDDIKGTKPKTFQKTLNISRKTNDISDIDGSRPKKEYMVNIYIN